MHGLSPYFHGLDLNLIACRLRKLVLFTEETDTTPSSESGELSRADLSHDGKKI